MNHSHTCFLFPPGIEARGFIFGLAIALAIGAKFIPLRKPRKLPGEWDSYGCVCWASSEHFFYAELGQLGVLNTDKWSIQFWWIGLDIEFTGAVRDNMYGSVVSMELFLFFVKSTKGLFVECLNSLIYFISCYKHKLAILFPFHTIWLFCRDA